MNGCNREVMKNLAKALIRAGVKRLPWGANEALFEAVASRIGADDVIARCAPRLNYLHLCAEGKYGLMQSSLNDGLLLPTYGRTGSYDEDLATLFHEFFARHDGGTYLDIGANIGLTVIPVATDPRVKCLAFEPDPMNNRHLRANVQRNCRNSNVEICPVALFSSRTRMRFVRSEQNIGDHRVDPSGSAAGHAVEVDAVPLDEFAGVVQGAVAVKMDTQGAESFVIAGGRGVLSRASLVVLEFSPPHMRAVGSDPHIVLEYLAGFTRIGLRTVRGSGIPALQSAAEAVGFLEAKFAAWKRGDVTYWDVFATRENEAKPA
jgi:FkbM family methyltransferase